MPDKFRAGNREYNRKNVPPGFDDWRPGGIGDPESLEDAEVNALLNAKGSERIGCILIGVIVLFVGTLIWFLASL
jgi:hypothetical protein